MTKKILLSGAKPTGIPHIGNYFGALKQFVDLQGDYETYIMIADYHALTSVHDAKLLRELTNELVLTYLGIGIDPEKVTLFRQSDSMGHTDLSWIFDCITTMPYLMRAHAFKDAEVKDKEINVGLFNYPMLMAADILLYDTDVVPVGRDQKQHIEYTRDTAQKFNNTFGETFKLPKEIILESVETIPGTDGRKMSKSYGNEIPLFGTDDEIKKAVMSIVTDSSGDTPTNVYAIHKLFRSESELAALYEEKKGKYKDLKEALLADILDLVHPMRQRRAEFEKQPDLVAKILAAGAEKARARAAAKMKLVRERVGL
ncbi:MAG: tryptophan--tRNA ligase [Candidatus Pacebacteria bacterium]|nr:tryptophan--tRNA ligase [Candidatus Paceibacterota bacterium]